jgi:bifunctional DNA-binding transcriptional regulator/antitoxin component of YhaV-PrlF toxin-antitoxin module
VGIEDHRSQYYPCQLKYYRWSKAVGSRVTRKGQVTIPKRVPGSVVDFELGADGRIVLTVVGAEPKPSRFERFRGIAKTKLTTDELMAMLRGDD